MMDDRLQQKDLRLTLGRINLNFREYLLLLRLALYLILGMKPNNFTATGTQGLLAGSIGLGALESLLVTDDFG
jgi:hypothetical protein